MYEPPVSLDKEKENSAPDVGRWQPSATLETLRYRANFLAEIRAFFTTRGYLEVETPMMAHYGVTDIYLENIKAQFRGQSYCLQTSPEYHMKRLLAAGAGPIFQLARVFRDDELGRWHNPEFTLLEWYQLNIDHHALMDEIDHLLQHLLACAPLIKITYQQLFLDCCGIDPLTAEIKVLQDALQRFALEGILAPGEKNRDQYLFLLMSHVVEKALAKEPTPVAVFNFPPSQAALAKVNAGVAERFEVYYRGIELANGYHEGTDATLLRARFQHDQNIRKQRGLPLPKMDEFLLSAMQHGLPPCSGVALGMDRLFALAQHHTAIAQTLSFDFSRA